MTERITVRKTDERCFRCGVSLVELDPPLEGWKYYCVICEAYTITDKQFDDQWTEHEVRKARGEPVPIGYVAQLPRKLNIIWEEE